MQLNATILCNNTGYILTLNFHFIHYVHISGINFINCREAEFYKMSTLVIENSSIMNQHIWSLGYIANTTIARTSFLNGHTLKVENSSLILIFLLWTISLAITQLPSVQLWELRKPITTTMYKSSGVLSPTTKIRGDQRQLILIFN